MDPPDLISSSEDLLPRELEAAMDTIAYNLDSPVEGASAATKRRASRARQRSQVLRRGLLAADVVAALASGLLTGLTTGMSLGEMAAVALVLLVGTVLFAFF